MYRLMVTGRFAAAHNLRNFNGRCEACTATTGRWKWWCRGTNWTGPTC